MIAAVKKKPSLATLVIGMGKPKASDEPDEDDTYDEDFAAAAKESFDAQKSGDLDAYTEALKAAIMSCMSSE